MKTFFRLSGLMILSSFIFLACQKETSFEKGNSRASVGSLSVDTSGNCLGAVIGGTYYKDSTLTAAHYVDVSVKVDTVGAYTIITDTVNGYYFKASGTFTATGTQVIRLTAGGKPLSTGTDIFTVIYNFSFCQFPVTVNAPAGGSSAFTVTCTGATPAGTYTVGTALTSGNTITLSVNVTAIGTWSVTTAPAVNGIIFAGTGTFTNTGTQTIQLNASGTPTAAGVHTFTVTGGTGTCTFQVTTTSVPAVPDYFPRTAFSNWSYDYDGDPDDSVLIYVIQPTVVKNGNTYNVFMYNDGYSPIDTFGYYRRSGPDYFEWGDLSYGLLDDPVRGEFIFLKDNQTVNATWNSQQFTGDYTDGMGNTFAVTLRWKMTILQQNGSVSVTPASGITTNYTNVIEVKQELEQLVGTAWSSVGYFRNYYSRDKGLMKQDFYNNTGGLESEGSVKRFVVY